MGCSSTPASPDARDETRLNIRIEAVRDLNPDNKERPAPVIVRVYELKSEASFLQADFFSLQNADKAALTEDLLARNEFIMRPGDLRSIRRRANPQTNAIGVLVAFRDLPNAVWREAHVLPPPPEERKWYQGVLSATRVNLHVILENNAVRIVPFE
jgi:type VI secretion system protein VasD